MEEKWILLKIDLNKKEVFVLDPYGNRAEQNSGILIDYLVLLNKYNEIKSGYAGYKKLDDLDWSTKTFSFKNVNLPYEGSLLNIHFLDELTKSDGNVLSNDIRNINVEDLGSELQKLLLKYSSNVAEFCPYCKQFENKTIKKCDVCMRWVHIACDRNLESISGVESQSFVYYCELCSSNFNINSYFNNEKKLFFKY